MIEIKKKKKRRCVLRATKKKEALWCDSEIKPATFLQTAACFNISTVIHNVSYLEFWSALEQTWKGAVSLKCTQHVRVGAVTVKLLSSSLSEILFQANCSQICLIPKHARGSEVFTRNGLDQISVLYIKWCRKDFSVTALFDFLAPARAVKATCGRMAGANRWSR